jgi:predicted TIM-barrel fold metal-dependent hydrolase
VPPTVAAKIRALMAPEPVVDAHIHVWRLADLPWLSGPPVPRIFGPYAPLRRDYPITEYLAGARPAGVEAAVYVQANWPLERALAEVEWVQRVHDEHGWPQAIVASADMFDARAPDTFALQREASALVRGVRVQLHWHADARLSFADAADRMLDPTFARNVAELGALGLCFELQVFPPQMADAAALVAQTPQTTFVLVHAGMLESVAAEHVEPWRTGLEQLAALPNVVVKLSGQGTFVHRVDEPLIRLVAGTALELFGAQRCMFGSNFPIEHLWTDYDALLDAWRRCLADLDAGSRRDVLAGTARRVYGL